MCGVSETDLEGRFEVIRTQESNLGNFVCDLILTEYKNADFVFMNSGTLRSNTITPAGPITLKMVSQIIPMPDKVCQLKMLGRTLLNCLENSVR